MRERGAQAGEKNRAESTLFLCFGLIGQRRKDMEAAGVRLVYKSWTMHTDKVI